MHLCCPSSQVLEERQNTKYQRAEVRKQKHNCQKAWGEGRSAAAQEQNCLPVKNNPCETWTFNLKYIQHSQFSHTVTPSSKGSLSGQKWCRGDGNFLLILQERSPGCEVCAGNLMAPLHCWIRHMWLTRALHKDEKCLGSMKLCDQTSPMSFWQLPSVTNHNVHNWQIQN